MRTHEIKFFCDRCGKEFKLKEGQTSFTIQVPYSPRYRIVKVGSEDDYLDLCDECKGDFIYWLTGELE